MKDIEAIRSNERVRSVSRSFVQVGTALASADVVKIYVDSSFSLEFAGWMLGAIGLIFVGLKALDLFQLEE